MRTVSLEGRFFPRSWPPKHVIAVYPAGRETFVTVLLFGLYGFNVRLPIEVPKAVRYVQHLTDDICPILEQNDHARDFGRDDRLTDDDMDAFRTNVQWRHDYLMDVGAHLLRLQCRRAAKRAFEMMVSSGLDIVGCYRAQLQMEALTSAQIGVLMHYAAAAAASGRPIWDVPFDYST